MVTERGEPPVESVSGLVFGSVADRYERYRLGYPDELFAAVLRYAGRPIRVAVEVGAGTGKATRLFASRGVEVTALEPDAEMADLLARTTQGLPVEPVVVTFERFRIERRFDLVYAAAAWHWADPRTRWAKAVELLVPGGVLALFGHPAELTDPVPVRGGRRDRAALAQHLIDVGQQRWWHAQGADLLGGQVSRRHGSGDPFILSKARSDKTLL